MGIASFVPSLCSGDGGDEDDEGDEKGAPVLGAP